MRTWLEQASPWTVGLLLTAFVAGVSLGLPFAVIAVWSQIDPSLLVVGNLFLGMILGNGAMMAFMRWRSEIRR